MAFLFIFGAMVLVFALMQKYEKRKAENECSDPIHAKIVNVRKCGANAQVTFGFDDGNRKEILARQEYGSMGIYVIGDTGILKYGNNMLLSWARDKNV